MKQTFLGSGGQQFFLSFFLIDVQLITMFQVYLGEF